MGHSIELVETKLFAAVVADEIVASINDVLSEKPRCSLVLAGGKTPSTIYRIMAKPPRVSEVDWARVDFFWGDERWVPRSDLQSNFKMVAETLLTFLPGSQASTFGVDTAATDPQTGAAQYEATIRQRLCSAGQALPRFDLVLLGIGDDGHTASLFPQSDLLLHSLQGEPEPLCAAVRSAKDDGWRITLSPSALFSGEKIIFIVRGEGKASVLKRVLEQDSDFASTPAQLYRKAHGQVVFFADTAAAQYLALPPR